MAYTVPAGRYGDYSTAFIQAYINEKVASVVDLAPATLDTLNELAAAIGDDAAFFTTMATANATIQADVDANEAASDAAEAALSARLDTLEADPTTAAALAAIGVTASEARTALQTLLQNAIDAVQADVNTNEADADTAIGLEAAARTAAIVALQADVDTNESDADTAIALRATIDNPTFTTKIASPEFHSTGSHLKFKTNTNDIIFYPNNTETLQITRHSGTGHPTFTANGGSGEFKFNQVTDLAGGVKLAGTAVTATAAEINAFDGRLDTLEADPVTRAYVDTQVTNVIDAAPGALDTLNELAAALGDDANFATTITNSIAAVQADVNQNETDADAAIALKFDKTGGIVSSTAEFQGNVTIAAERLFFTNDAALIRLKDDNIAALTIENHDGTAGEFVVFDTQNAGLKLITKQPIEHSSTFTVGEDDTGYDVKLFGDTASAYALWDASADDLILAGEAGLEIPNAGRFVLGSNVVTSVSCALDMRNDLVFTGGARNIKFKDNTYNACRFQANNGDIFMGMDTQGDNTIFFQQPLDINTSAQIDGTLTVGVDDTGFDVKFFGDTASAYALWDASADDLILGGAAGLVVPDGQFTLGSTAVTSTAAELNYVDGVTSNVQTQLNAKAPAANATMTGTTSVAAVLFSGGLSDYANDTDAAAGGIPVNGLYRHNSDVKIRVS